MELLFSLSLLVFGSFAEPVDLDLDIEGNIYVIDAGRDLVVKYSSKGDSLDVVGGFGTGIEEFDRPVAVYARRGTDVYVADYNNHRVQRFDRRLDYITTIYTRDDPDERTRFGYPLDVAVSRQGDVLILDGENQHIVVFDASGRFVRRFGDVASGAGALVNPSTLELDASDNVYVLDEGRIKAYDPFGTWLRFVPLPVGRTAQSFSVEESEMMILTDSLLLLYDLEQRTMVDTVQVEPDCKPTAIRHHTRLLYVIETDHVDVRKLRDSKIELLQEN
ncbi:MAG: NHL repeat-containing protein [Chlorobi bacterium]|nr:NHL repeat-containing protein [Chlorobiota bacterium]